MHLRTVLTRGQDKKEALRILRKKYPNADVKLVDCTDQFGGAWTEAVITGSDVE